MMDQPWPIAPSNAPYHTHIGLRTPGKQSALDAVTVCGQAKTAKDCSDLLTAARNPSEAYDVGWGEKGFLRGGRKNPNCFD